MNRSGSGKLIEFLSAHKLKLAICAVLIAALFITPALTQAQYKWTLNGYTVLQAKEFHFTSNYLKPEQENAYYYTSAWDGKNSPLSDVEIQNFENSLLCNKEGEDLHYVFTWEISAVDNNGVPIEKGYTINNGKKLENGYRITKVYTGYNPLTFAFEDEITGDSCRRSIIGDGTPKKDQFHFVVDQPTLEGSDPNTPDKWTAPEGSKLTIKMTAYNTRDAESTDPSDSFYSKLTCTFEYMVSSSAGFVKQFDVTDGGTKDIEVNIGTGVIPNMDGVSQTIFVWWRSDRLQINPICKTFTDMVSADAGNYSTITFTGEDNVQYQYSLLRITGLQSLSERVLNMYKLSYEGKDRNEVWFNELDYSTLVVSNMEPTEAIPDGAFIGYYSLNTKDE